MTTATISGIWNVSETLDASDPGCAGTDNYNLTIDQNGEIITVGNSAGDTFFGSLTDNVVSWGGSYERNGGTTTITSLNGTLDAVCESITGTASWTWSNGTSSCFGDTVWTAARISGSGCPNDGSGTVGGNQNLQLFWQGTWTDKEFSSPTIAESPSYDFNISVTRPVEISLSGGPDTDPYLYLLDGSGNIVAQADDVDFASGDLDAEMSLTLAPGTYTAVAARWESIRTQGYTLWVALLPSDGSSPTTGESSGGTTGGGTGDSSEGTTGGTTGGSTGGATTNVNIDGNYCFQNYPVDACNLINTFGVNDGYAVTASSLAGNPSCSSLGYDALHSEDFSASTGTSGLTTGTCVIDVTN